MTEDDVLALVQRQASDVLGIPVEELAPDTDLLLEHSVDSLELMEIGTRLETRLGVRIDPVRLKDARTIGEVAAYLNQARP